MTEFHLAIHQFTRNGQSYDWQFTPVILRSKCGKFLVPWEYGGWLCDSLEEALEIIRVRECAVEESARLAGVSATSLAKQSHEQWCKMWRESTERGRAPTKPSISPTAKPTKPTKEEVKDLFAGLS